MKKFLLGMVAGIFSLVAVTALTLYAMGGNYITVQAENDLYAVEFSPWTIDYSVFPDHGTNMVPAGPLDVEIVDVNERGITTADILETSNTLQVTIHTTKLLSCAEVLDILYLEEVGDQVPTCTIIDPTLIVLEYTRPVGKSVGA